MVCIKRGLQVNLEGELDTQLSFVPEHLRFMLQEAQLKPLIGACGASFQRSDTRLV